MTNTPNIGLKKYDRSDNYSVGHQNENMDIIDQALDELATAKADRAPSATAGHLAALDGTGNPVDSGKSLSDLVPATRKVNGKALSGDIALSAADVGARPSNWTPSAAEVGADVAGSAAAVQTALTGHTGNKSNPHGVTAAQVGAAAASHTHTAASIGAAPAVEGVRTLTHSKSGTVHQLTGLSGAVGILSGRFKATAAFGEGNTFTVDGVAYTAALASGDALPDGAFVSGALVELLIDTSAKKLGFKAGGVPVGTLPSQSTISAAAGSGKVTLTISRPNSNDYAGTLIVRKTGSYPTGPSDGAKLQAGASSTYIDTGLTNGTTYYYRAFAYNSKKQYQTLTTGARVTAKPVAGIPLSSMAEGAIVNILENGVQTPFYVAKQNYESGLNGSGRTLVVRKDCYDNRQWNSSNVNAYASSAIDSWLNSTYKNLFPADIRTAMGTTKFYYTPGNGNTTVTTLQRAVFLLSMTELGQSYSYANVEGSALPIAESLKIAYLNGSANLQWARSPGTDGPYRSWTLNADGIPRYYLCSVTNGSRPAFTLPGSTLAKATANADGSYDLQLT